MKRYSSKPIIFFFFFFFLLAHLSNGQQISTSCTSLILSSFTPCLNFLTGSTNGGGSPSTECCKSLGSLISGGTQCACLVLTGSVPLSLPINRTLAITLPRLCNNTSVPLQCSTAVGTPLPGPGPVPYSPPLPALPPQTNTPTAGVVDSPPPEIASPPSISNTPADQGSQGLRPLILPSSATKFSTIHSSIVVMSIFAIMYLF